MLFYVNICIVINDLLRLGLIDSLVFLEFVVRADIVFFSVRVVLGFQWHWILCCWAVHVVLIFVILQIVNRYDRLSVAQLSRVSVWTSRLCEAGCCGFSVYSWAAAAAAAVYCISTSLILLLILPLIVDVYVLHHAVFDWKSVGDVCVYTISFSSLWVAVGFRLIFCALSAKTLRQYSTIGLGGLAELAVYHLA